jgi:ribosomal protein S18 acetylase RimI-like enzyme
VTVRWADPSDDRDIEELVRLRGVMFEGMGLSIPDDGWRAEIAGVLRTGIADGSFFAAVVDAPDGDGGLAACGVGMIWIGLPWPGDTVGRRGYVQSMATDPRWRRRGYAHAVVKALLDRFGASGVRQVALHASAAGVPLYRSLGFRESTYPELVWRAPRAWQ